MLVGHRSTSAELAEQGGHVRADPFFGEESVGDAVELVADVVDGASGRGYAQELAGVGAADPQPDGDLVLGGDDVFDVRLNVGEGASSS
jgi:hypothetical protein